MVPTEVVRILVDSELPGAQAWAARRGFGLEWLPDRLEVRLTMTQAATNELFYLRGRFDGYRALPPVWSFTDQGWQATAVARYFPRIERPPFGSPIFIFGGPNTPEGKGAVICAPFNRLAFVEEHGPHSDWSLAGWTEAGPGYVRACTLGDMLQAVTRDFAATRGRMSE